MKSTLKPLLFTTLLGLFLLLGTTTYAQTSCCAGDGHDKASCTTDHGKGDKTSCTTTAVADKQLTSGCSPSACRGAKTKYGEAKVITKLRTDLISLKADMEKSKNPSFDAKSYNIHGIVGQTDDESLEIIAKEIRKVEKAFAERTDYRTVQFSLPENKAKKILYLNQRIQALKGHL